MEEVPAVLMVGAAQERQMGKAQSELRALRLGSLGFGFLPTGSSCCRPEAEWAQQGWQGDTRRVQGLVGQELRRALREARGY